MQGPLSLASTLVDVNVSHATTATDPSRILKESMSQKVNAGPWPDFALETSVKPSVAPVTLHQIWYPLPSSYRDLTEENITPGPASDLNRHNSLPDTISEYIVQELMQMEQWRQYPAFPSGYPKTPFLHTSTLSNISAIMLSFANSEGDRTLRQQDFEQSLLISRASMEPNLTELLSDDTDQNLILDDNHENSLMDPSPSSYEYIQTSSEQTPYMTLGI
ncbi:hypothetical protein F5146DRAFT_1209257 [Armillaria mellea]|nr:hypothetical protein F5146DRAFT_1209257 [Armillaria mellea]